MIWVAAAYAAVSIASNMAANEQANANAEATRSQLKTQYDTVINSLGEQAEDVQRELGVNLTNIKLESMRASSQTSAAMAESGVVGATQGRINNNIAMQESLANAKATQDAEAKMEGIQANMTQAMYDANNGAFKTEMDRINNTKSTLEIGIEAAKAGMSGYMMGQGLAGSSAASTTTQFQSASPSTGSSGMIGIR